VSQLKINMSDISVDEQVAIIMNGAELGDAELRAFMEEELRQRLVQATREKRQLRIYCGYDVTGPHLHLGHTVTIRKLKQFQDLGHDVTLLVGSFTSLIGDASDKDTARTIRAEERIQSEAETYAAQAFRILDPARTTIRYNHQWLGELSFRDLIELTGLFTVQQFLSRDNFRKRYETGDAIWLREFLYPLAQGYDAVALKSDVQIGATEQLFNLMAGRKLQEHFDQQPQICITYPILVGTDGVIRMSKSVGNYIGITEDPINKYGKVMSIPDNAMESYIRLLTRWSLGEMNELIQAVAEGSIHPMEAKKMLAWEITASFDGDDAADNAAEHFARVHQKRELPDSMPEYHIAEGTPIVDILKDAGLCRSKSEVKRLVQQNGVRLNGEIVTDAQLVVEPSEAIIQVGKRHFLLLNPKIK